MRIAHGQVDSYGEPMNLTDRRWEAIVTRDSAAEDRFFYGVATTGVYCRPGSGRAGVANPTVPGPTPVAPT